LEFVYLAFVISRSIEWAVSLFQIPDQKFWREQRAGRTLDERERVVPTAVRVDVDVQPV
jgi:hypothetical protein